MKTLFPVLLAVSTVGGLAYVGLAPERKPEPAAEPVYKGAYQPAPAPPKEDEFAFVLAQMGPPPPFDPTRPIICRIPAGYSPFPAGDLFLQPQSTNVWHAHGFDWSVNVVQHILPTGRHATLNLRSDTPGAHPSLPGQPNAFADSLFIGADGLVTPGSFPPNPLGFATRFPGNGGSWLVFQP